MGFPPATGRALTVATKHVAQLPMADSLGVDLHKFGYAPYASSVFLVRQGSDMAALSHSSTQAPYLFHDGDGDYHPVRTRMVVCWQP